MVVDFQHHFTPREFFKDDLGDKLIITFDETGAPSYTSHKLLYDLDEHIRMMDVAGIDAAFLTCGAGMCAVPSAQAGDPDVARLYGQAFPSIDPDKRYFVSIAAEGFQMGGAPVVFSGGSGSTRAWA